MESKTGLDQDRSHTSKLEGEGKPCHFERKADKTDAPTRVRERREATSDSTNDPVQSAAPRRKGERRKAKAAATAWKMRNQEYLNRRSEVIEFPEQAIGIWQSVRADVEHETKYGRLRGGVGKPSGLAAARPPMVGDSIERQIYDRVEHERLFVGEGETLADRIERWPLPCTFYDPVPPLCPADVAAIREQENREAIGSQRQAEARSREGHGDGRLLPGMERGDGLHP